MEYRVRPLNTNITTSNPLVDNNKKFGRLLILPLPALSLHTTHVYEFNAYALIFLRSLATSIACSGMTISMLSLVMAVRTSMITSQGELQ